MRPETTSNNSGKSPYAFSNLKQTTILNILIVVIMMRMTYASIMQFYENINKSMIRGISRHGGRKKGATTAKTETVPRQRSDDPTTS